MVVLAIRDIIITFIIFIIFFCCSHNTDICKFVFKQSKCTKICFHTEWVCLWVWDTLHNKTIDSSPTLPCYLPAEDRLHLDVDFVLLPSACTQALNRNHVKVTKEIATARAQHWVGQVVQCPPVVNFIQGGVYPSNSFTQFTTNAFLCVGGVGVFQVFS